LVEVEVVLFSASCRCCGSRRLLLGLWRIGLNWRAFGEGCCTTTSTNTTTNTNTNTNTTSSRTLLELLVLYGGMKMEFVN